MRALGGTFDALDPFCLAAPDPGRLINDDEANDKLGAVPFEDGLLAEGCWKSDSDLFASVRRPAESAATRSVSAARLGTTAASDGKRSLIACARPLAWLAGDKQQLLEAAEATAPARIAQQLAALEAAEAKLDDEGKTLATLEFMHARAVDEARSRATALTCSVAMSSQP